MDNNDTKSFFFISKNIILAQIRRLISTIVMGRIGEIAKVKEKGNYFVSIYNSFIYNIQYFCIWMKHNYELTKIVTKNIPEKWYWKITLLIPHLRCPLVVIWITTCKMHSIAK